MAKKKKPRTKQKLFQTALAVFILLLIVLLIKQLPSTQEGDSINRAIEQPINQNVERVEITGVKVANFLDKDNSLPDSAENVPVFITISQTPDYHLFYIPADELFAISITSYPFDEHLSVAEKMFLNTLAINETDACKLNVDITTPTFANPDKAGDTYPLSFCE